MEIFFALLIKLTTIFFGSGIVILFAFWIASEISTIPKLIFSLSKKKGLKIAKNTKISTRSGFYEVQVRDNDSIKIFSSPKGMKVLG